MDADIIASLSNQIPLLAKAAFSLPFAAVLGTALAFRPRRDGTPRRDMEVIHTQIPIDQLTDTVSKELQNLESAGNASFTWKRKKVA